MWQEMAEGGRAGPPTHGSHHCSVRDHPISAERKETRERIQAERETLTEKSSGTGESKTNPLDNLPL